MRLQLDRYAHLDSPIHRWSPRFKFAFLTAVVIAFAAIQHLWLVPPMVAFALGLYALSQMPASYLIHRLRYPGIFLITLIVVLPFFAGQTVLWQLGPLSIKTEGVVYTILVVSRFFSILTVSVVIFGTSPFMVHVRELRALGVSPILTDTLLLTVRYLHEISDMLGQMQQAMRLRGFEMKRLNIRQAGQLAGLLGTLLVRSYEQSERVYTAMRLRGYSAKEAAMTTATTETALQLNDIAFAYPGHQPVVTGVSLAIADGERVGLIGPNGAGKSSLLLTICGVHAPSNGEVALYGNPVTAGAFHPAVGLVFQNSNDQLFSSTVHDDVAFGPRNMGLNDEDVEARVADALAKTRTQHLAERIPHHLSGGEKRMVSIASVLAMRPKLVLYDEPDANLDMRARRQLIRFLQDAPHTVLLASHDLEMVLEVCDRVLLLDDGHIIADGDPATIMSDAALMEAHGLEKPHSLVPHRHADGSVHRNS